MYGGQIPGEVAVKDASHWQGPLTGSRFPGLGLNLKFSQNDEFVDEFCGYNAEQCLANDRPVGAYHFLQGKPSETAEAKHFYNTVKNEIGLDAIQLGFWGDIENRYTGFNPTKYAAYARNFLDEAQQLFGTWVGIYTSPGFWDHYIARNDWAHKHWLWNAQWPYHPYYQSVPPSSAIPWIPFDWTSHDARKKCILWQYEGDGNLKAKDNGFPGRPAYAASLDFGRWLWEGRMGTYEEFAAFFLSGEPPDPPDPPVIPPFPPEVRIDSGGNLRLRDAPNTNTSQTRGWCRDGTIWYPKGLVYDEVGRGWYSIYPEDIEDNLYFAAWLTDPIT